MPDAMTPVTTPERSIFPPETISAAAREGLSAGAALVRPSWPDPADLEGWRVAAEQSEERFRPIVDGLLANARTPITDEILGGVPCYVAAPEGADGRVYLYIHGGAFAFGGGRFAKAQAAGNAEALGIRTVSVDYRMPPEHPFPAAPQDCLAVYEALLETVPAGRIVIGGGSAGGNLAAVTTLMIRDKGLPLPAGVTLLTPEVDLTEAGDSFRTNALLDVVLKGTLAGCNALYAAGTPLDHPYLSPLLADLAGFPPTFIQTGTRDLFLSNSVLFHRKLRGLGIRADLHVWEAMPHGGFGASAPEDAEIAVEMKAFIESLL